MVNETNEVEVLSLFDGSRLIHNKPQNLIVIQRWDNGWHNCSSYFDSMEQAKRFWDKLTHEFLV